MIINDANLETLRTLLRSEFQAGFDGAEAQTLHGELATRVPSTTKSNTYGWLSKFPQLKEWIGSRTLRSIAETSYQIVNKKYEATVDVERTDFEDEDLGIYAPMARNMGYEARVFPTRQLAALMKAGTAALGYDGQNFFDTDHPFYANEDGTGAAATYSNYQTGVELGWYLLDCSRPLKPFIFQERTQPEFDAVTDPKTGGVVFMDDKYLYGIRYRMNVGFGFHQCAYKSEVELTPESFEAAYRYMQETKRDGGDPMGIMPTHLVVPPALRSAAKKIAEAEFVSGGDSNINANAVTPVVTPWLA